jgi:MSHA biogenesis protein MshJ
MKQYWDKLATKIDSLTLRERVIIFGMAALILVTLVNSLLLDAQFSKQNQLTQKIRQDQAQIAAIQADIQAKVKAQETDPDAQNRARLNTILLRADQLQASMRDMQKGLISPDKMGALLEGMLKSKNRLRLVSLKKLPTTGLVDALPSNDGTRAQAAAPGASASETHPVVNTVFKHGVEITVQGSYLDMLDYMADLEGMPWQLFWNKVKLNVDEYPNTTLTLTVFTLSLDKKWLNI